MADGNNNRALVFFSPMPMTAVSNVPGNFGDATADVAIGQADLVSGECNQGGSATLTTLCIGGFFGVGIAADGGDNLYIGDTLNNRALENNGPFGYGRPTTSPRIWCSRGITWRSRREWRPIRIRIFMFRRKRITRCTSTRSRCRYEDGPAQPSDWAGRAESERGIAAISDGAGDGRGKQSCTSRTRRTTGCWSSTSSARPATGWRTARAGRSISHITGLTTSMRWERIRRAGLRSMRPRSRRIGIYMSPTASTIACSGGAM